MQETTTLALLGFYGALLALDLFAPARALPKVPFWRLLGLASFVASISVATFAPLLWDGLLAEYRLFDLTGLGTVAGIGVGMLALDLAQYGWHRMAHASPFLWRASHQMHHSAERIDVFGAFWFHPIDMVGFTLMGSLALVLVVGLTPEATAISMAVMTGLSIFQHANLKTPRWLGYLVQRPEQHGLHHERGVHGFNYGSLAIFDQLFGTFRNPATWDAPAGFYEGASSRVWDMLLGRDVTVPRTVRGQERAEEERSSLTPRAA